MKPSYRIATLGFAVVLSSCQSTENWTNKEVLPLPDQFATNQLPQIEIKESLLDVFADPNLSELVESSLQNNPDLLRARAKVAELEYTLGKTRSSSRPSLSASAGAGESQAAGASSTETYSAALSASWEIDVWGRLRAGATASKADLSASAADLKNAEQSLAGQTMQAWFSLIAADKLLDLNQRSVDSFTSTLRTVERRFELGETNASSLNLAKTDFENANADLESTRNARDQAVRRLKALIGEYPNSDYLDALEWPTPLGSVAEGIPSELLQQRPDIQAAFERLRAADSRTTVAQTAIFPSFKLTASGGRSSSILEDLSDSAFDSWSALAALTLNLFDGGSRKSDIGAAKSRTEQAYYSYQSVILNALREVENALGSENYLAREEVARTAALDAARKSLERSRRDYETGLTTLLSLLETQRRVFSTERQVINLKASRLNNRVNLALALGKGF